MNDHSGHGAGRVTGEHRHDLTGAAGHAGHGQGHKHLSHVGHADVYRRRFWITLILAVPVVVYSEMIQDWFGFTAPQFPGDGLMRSRRLTVGSEPERAELKARKRSLRRRCGDASSQTFQVTPLAQHP